MPARAVAYPALSAPSHPALADRRMHAARDAESTAAATMASREVKDQAKAVEMAFKQGAKESQRQAGFDPNRSHNSMARVKNKQPAPVQITAEQLLREARERQEGDGKPPRLQSLQSPLYSDFAQEIY
jgi:FKBP-type peptidyl-prolyl cis-trans isomerase